jgi:hypothetical protein
MPVKRALRLTSWGLLAVVALLVAYAVATTGKDIQPAASLTGGAPVAPWSEPCWRRGRYTLECARVRGRVIFRQDEDPDGDGDGHVVVISGLGLVTLKVRRSTGIQLPGYGAEVTAVGRYARGTGQLGSDIVDVSSLTSY